MLITLKGSDAERWISVTCEKILGTSLLFQGWGGFFDLNSWAGCFLGHMKA